MPLPIDLIDATTSVSLPTVLARHPDPLVACDFYIDGAEQGEEVPGGYRVDRVVNIDHHAPTPRMTRQISSANLALEQLAAAGRPAADAVVVINHTDCDSILSSGLMSGRLEPDPRFADAAVAADHTGAADPIADLLQALDRPRDVELSFRSLKSLLAGRLLGRDAQAALAARLRKRERAVDAVARGQLARVGPLAVGVFAEEVDGEFFPALLPDAAVILLAYPRAEEPARWNVKLRLGAAAPPGFTLHRLRLPEFDPVYGGRWNAGANRRGGGTTIEPERYAAEVARRAGALIDEVAAAARPAE